ncbi:Wadjet anti-phage system protein JetA family protein [Aureimonas pseudogalii]|uniref:Uncharacterized protein n=1 Tax=Aureimonas pseudogalii TaxID=1744844 RepID=A0A7W6H4V9_9HYPH|nr:Wadjet anti-phage system protein JetA family protein [Aureimonas pseudogalii]MBB3998539.1 hypothetical protein [Aureimonas pseudogalii]
MPLFDVLPPDLFRPLAAASKQLYAELLLHLHRTAFALAGEAPSRSEVVGEIEAFLTGFETGGEPAADDELPDVTRPEDRPSAYYARLIETGWLVEHRERYVRRVDLDPDAAGLLHLLSQIERGETRTYGGAVLGVLAALESAASQPLERSESLQNAARESADFMAHMRTVSVSLRQAEDRILRQPTLREVFRHFFEDFVERHLIRDFKTLHTKDNPFRFRSGIVRQAVAMAEDAALVAALGAAYAREGRAPDAGEGEARVRGELAEIERVFEAAASHLDAIDGTVARIERRIVNAARYMDRIANPSQALIAEALRVVAGFEGDEVPVATALLPRILPLGPVHIPAPRRERAPIEPTILHDTEPDPAVVLYARAKEEYVRRTRVTAPVLAAFLERALGAGSQVRGRDIGVVTVDDFVAFQRLRELPSIFGGALAKPYEIVLLPERCSNDWISCQDFLIRRRPTGQTHAA